MIEISNLEKRYTSGDELVTACAVDHLHVERGEQIALIGRSGLGKTTLLNMIAGIVRPSTGSVTVDGTDLATLSESGRDSFRAANIGIVFQTFNLLVPFTALENVLLGAVFGRRMNSSVRGRAEDLLKRVGLADRMSHLPSQLSVGQIQRVAICRAMINEPQLILADEPLGNQDRQTGGEVLDLMLEMAREEERTVVLVTHDPGSAKHMQRTIDLADLRRAS